MKIFLVGMPGCGKSTIGKLLAQELDFRFLDLDTMIEEKEGLAVTEVFAQKGQEYFRQVEADALRSLDALTEGVVLATGGGAACFHENMVYMTTQGVSVYLKVSPEELVNRLTQQDLEVRPLLRGKTKEELKVFLTQTLSQREPFYLQANHVIEAGSQGVQSVVNTLQQRLTLD